MGRLVGGSRTAINFRSSATTEYERGVRRPTPLESPPCSFPSIVLVLCIGPRGAAGRQTFRPSANRQIACHMDPSPGRSRDSSHRVKKPASGFCGRCSACACNQSPEAELSGSVQGPRSELGVDRRGENVVKDLVVRSQGFITWSRSGHCEDVGRRTSLCTHT